MIIKPVHENELILSMYCLHCYLVVVHDSTLWVTNNQYLGLCSGVQTYGSHYNEYLEAKFYLLGEIDAYLLCV